MDAVWERLEKNGFIPDVLAKYFSKTQILYVTFWSNATHFFQMCSHALILQVITNTLITSAPGSQKSARGWETDSCIRTLWLHCMAVWNRIYMTVKNKHDILMVSVGNILVTLCGCDKYMWHWHNGSLQSSRPDSSEVMSCWAGEKLVEKERAEV